MSTEPTFAMQFGFSAENAKATASAAFDLIDAGDFKGAETIFRGLLALNPNDPAMHAALGSVLQEQGRNTEAESEYDQAIALESETPLARLNRGELRLKRGDQGGLEDLRIVSEISCGLQWKAKQKLRAFSPT